MSDSKKTKKLKDAESLAWDMVAVTRKLERERDEARRLAEVLLVTLKQSVSEDEEDPVGGAIPECLPWEK